MPGFQLEARLNGMMRQLCTRLTKKELPVVLLVFLAGPACGLDESYCRYGRILIVRVTAAVTAFRNCSCYMLHILYSLDYSLHVVLRIASDSYTFHALHPSLYQVALSPVCGSSRSPVSGRYWVRVWVRARVRVIRSRVLRLYFYRLGIWLGSTPVL